MNGKTIGIDLAKNLIAVCVLDASGKLVERRNLRFGELAAWLAQLPAGCEVAMEACGAAHYWGRRVAALGLVAKIMAPEFVKPFRKSRKTKNDANDAEAIAVAAQQPTMRFVPVKSEDQQARLAWHRAREGWRKERLALTNRMRGLLFEFGRPLAQGDKAFVVGVQESIHDEALPAPLRQVLVQAQEHLKELDERLAACDKAIAASAREDADCRRLMRIGGVGVQTADAAKATAGDGHGFKNGRQFAASLGLVPRQYGTGGKVRLGHITKRGDCYLRTLLVQGARSTLQAACRKAPERRSRFERWAAELYGRVGFGKTLVAIANKHARQIWAVLAKGEEYDPDAWQKHQVVM